MKVKVKGYAQIHHSACLLALPFPLFGLTMKSASVSSAEPLRPSALTRDDGRSEEVEAVELCLFGVLGFRSRHCAISALIFSKCSWHSLAAKSSALVELATMWSTAAGAFNSSPREG